jgi:tRNA nucleotidyltransferase/poly(A) polymerase
MGRKHTPETIEKLRAARLRIKLSPELRENFREKMSAAKQGRKLSPEHIEKIRLALLGRKLSPEHIEKMRAAKLGRKLSPEHIEKIRLLKLQQTPEVRYKNSQAHLIKGPQHHLSNVCDFRSPTNVVWHVSNIGHFVRTHKHLFDESDATWINSGRSLRCRAADGLRSLCSRASPLSSWKGWTLVSDVEHFKNDGNDLLDRAVLQE